MSAEQQAVYASLADCPVLSCSDDPICSFNVFLLLVSVVFWGGGERYEWCLDGVVVWGR